MIRLEIPLERLHRLLTEPAAVGNSIHLIGDLNVLTGVLVNDSPPLGERGLEGFERSQTWLILPKQLLLLVDTFKAAQPESFQLVLPSLEPIERIGHAFVTRDGLHLHPLGDYFPLDHHPFQLTFTQRFIQGRFLLAVSRDPEARFRVLNGWSIEARLQGRVYHLLHSNQSRKLRPLGPVRTDALYGIAEWTPAPELVERTGFVANLALMQAGQIEWSEIRKATIQPPADVVYRTA